MSKKALVARFMAIRMITKINTVLFDGGYACDDFLEDLTISDFELHTKIPINYWFNNGTNVQLKT
jgi:hypothetical protein